MSPRRFRLFGARTLAPCIFLAVMLPGQGRAQTPVPAPASPAAASASATPPPAPAQTGDAHVASITGSVTDTSAAVVPGAHVSLEDAHGAVITRASADLGGAFTFTGLAPGDYIVKVTAPGFASWKVKDILVLHPDEQFTLPPIELGVEAISTSVNAISMEDLAEQQITAEEHQRILGILPNFYVSYLPNAAPLMRRQKFKLAFTVSTDPVTFFTTGVTAAIEQAQGDFSGYGSGFPGYTQRYAATYGDRLASTLLGAAVLPSLFHQDPRYFYKGTGSVVRRALYAISTVVICKGDNGHWQPNYSNVLGNLGAAGISASYYPHSDQHTVQVTIDNSLIGIATGSFGTLFQEFLLRHLTHGAPPRTP